MFGKKARSKNVSATDTYIGEGTIIEGNISTTASLQIEGGVIGDIECAGDITIGEKGKVHSIISARNVLNAGTIVGSVCTRGKLMITRTGRVEGNVSTGTLHISEGGVFKGECSMELPSGGELGENRNYNREDKHKEKSKDKASNGNGKATA